LKKSWTEPPETPIPPSLSVVVGGHPLVAQTLARRGILDPSQAQGFLDPDAYQPADPNEMPEVPLVVERLMQAIRGSERICVWGDFDVDGQTATTLLVSTLQELGAEVFYHIPVRAVESHGVNLPNLEKVIAQGAQIVLTCDTGITAHEAVEYARKRGVEMIITDHHELPADGEPLPPAHAVVTPRLLPADHPLSSLPGVGVAYILAQSLYRHFDREGDVQQYLDLVALGIVADLALLTGEARYLLQRGLAALRRAERLGLRMVMELADLNPANISEEHIGFILAPRLNAIGRLGDANPVVELLTTPDEERARLLALDLETLNTRRKLLTDQVYQGALAQIDKDPSLAEEDALVLAHPSWPAGVLGIVASRLVERFYKPALLLVNPPGELARGSARSVDGVHITAAIATQQELLKTYGGHPMAAGLSLEAANIPEFRRGLSRAVRAMRDEAPLESAIQIDAYLSLEELTLELVADLERLAPFGPGNPPLILASQDLRLLSQAPVGRDGEHLLLSVEDPQGATRQVVFWHGAGEPLPEGRFDLAYTVHASTYRGQRDVQVQWLDFRPVEEGEVELRPARFLEVVDYRQHANPLPILQDVLSESGIQLWREGARRDNLGGQDRLSLAPAPTLVIWTTPPGPVELRQVLESIQPNKVILIGEDPPDVSLEGFLNRLAGLVKHALQTSQGKVAYRTLAAATAQQEGAVRLGLRWLQANGSLRIQEESLGDSRLAPGSGSKSPDLPALTAQLKALLDETAAYRQYFRRAPAENLVNPG
jgi:single-stranded-DNA-specific exonuclease